MKKSDRANSNCLVPQVVVALPFAYQDGVDKYNGIMRYLRDTGTDWSLKIVREVLTLGQFHEAMTEAISGVICGSIGYVESGRVDSILPIEVECDRLCKQLGKPFVGIDWPFEKPHRKPSHTCSFFNINSEKIGEFAAEVLMKAGNYESYGFVGMYQDSVWSRDRGAYFTRTLRKHGRRQVQIFRGDVLTELDRLADWLGTLRKPVAIFASQDQAADIVLKTCMRNGLRVPDDIAVLGVDDDPVFCVHTQPTLTSIHPDFEEMGYRAAKELAALMHGQSRGCSEVVAGTLSVSNRMSTAPCSPSGRLVRRIDEIIATRLGQNLTTDVIADELKVSRRLLDLRYRQLEGRSIREAIVLARIDRARHLLKFSGHSIEAICHLCGYRTMSYPMKIFKQYAGVTMAEYRKSFAIA